MAASMNLSSKVAIADKDVDFHQAGKVTLLSEEVSGFWQISFLTSRVPEAGDEGENVVSCGLPGSVVANFLTWKEGSISYLVPASTNPSVSLSTDFLLASCVI